MITAQLTFVVRKHRQIKVPPRIVKSRCFKKFNDTDFIDSICNIDWSQICCIDDVNAALVKWQSLFTNICNTHAPFKEKKIKGHLPEWVNYDFIKLSKDRDYFYAKAHKTNEPIYWNKAKDLRNKVNNMKFYLKKNYCNKAVKDNLKDSKNLWKVIKKIVPSKSSSTANTNLLNSKDTAAAFNDYFTSIGNKLGEHFESINKNCTCNNLCSEHTVSDVDTFKFTDITPDFVYKQICNMNNDKSPGLDGLNVKLLKLAAPYISNCIAHICNLSLYSSQFPDNWKRAKVTPIYKTGDKSDVSNYRPISVLPITSKIIERAVHEQLYNYISSTNNLSSAQSGFRSNHSTTTTLLDVQDFILKNMDEGYATGAIFLDLKKAFDTVNHEILIDKLCNYGIKGNELSWFKSYLSNRSQVVNINSNLSEPKNINIGVPQGSILGPLLFIIFVNCLPGAVNCKTIMYADDTTLLFKARCPDELSSVMTSNLYKVANWLEANKLTLNIDKTKMMIFGTTQVLDRFHDVTLNYSTTVINRVTEFKYLGVKFDNTMSWSPHVDYLAKTISKRIGIIKRVKHFLPHSILVMLSNALVNPHFDYASPVWGNFSQVSHAKLQVMHNRLARTILSADIRTPIIDMLNSLQWDNLSDRWKKQMLVVVFKCLKNISPPYLSSQFVFVHNTHMHATRNHSTNTLVIPKCNTNSGLRTFHVRAGHLWNSVPPSIRSELSNMSLRQFKLYASTMSEPV